MLSMGSLVGSVGTFPKVLCHCGAGAHLATRHSHRMESVCMYGSPVLAMVPLVSLGMSMAGHVGGEGEQLRVSVRACTT